MTRCGLLTLNKTLSICHISCQFDVHRPYVCKVSLSFFTAFRIGLLNFFAKANKIRLLFVLKIGNDDTHARVRSPTTAEIDPCL